MEVFWEKGYEGAQLIDLTAAMGINPPSFYAAFGCKEAAFREALALYQRKLGEAWIASLDSGADTRRCIRSLLDLSIEVALSAPGAGGCMMVMSMINAMPVSLSLTELVRQRRQEAFRLVRERLERGVREGDLPPSSDVERLAIFYGAILQAISLQAREGASRKELDDIAASAMMAMPPENG